MEVTVRSLLDAIWLGIGMYWFLSATRLAPTLLMPPAPTRPLEVKLLVLAGLLLFIDWPDATPAGRFLPGGISMAAGLLLVLAGAFLAIVSRTVLGGNWTAAAAIRKEHSFVSRGPYRFARHPIYLGLFICALGSALALGEWSALLGAVLLLVAFYLKAHSEERLLAQAFGPTYDRYRERVSVMIVPFVF